MAIVISNAAAAVCANGVVDLLDADASAGYIEIRTLAPPTTVETVTGTLLATVTLSKPAFGNAVDIAPGSRATANTITGDNSIDASGTPGHFVAFDGAGVAVFAGTVGATGSGADLEVSNTSFVANGTFNITSLTYTQPES